MSLPGAARVILERPAWLSSARKKACLRCLKKPLLLLLKLPSPHRLLPRLPKSAVMRGNP